MELNAGGFYCKKRVLGKGRSEERFEGVRGEICEPLTNVLGVFFAEHICGSDARVGGASAEADEPTPHVAIREEAQARRPRLPVDP